MRVLVVGATGELGTAVSLLFAQRGANVAVHGWSDQRGLDSLAREIESDCALRADLTIPGECERIIEEAATGGHLDALVIASGVNLSAATVADSTDEDLERTFAVNLVAPFRLIRAAIPKMRRDGASVVVVSSVFGIHTPANRGLYGMSKHGLTGLVQAVAKEEGGRPRINEVCPGPMWSENVRRIFAQHAREASVDVESYVRDRMRAIPAGRFLEPSECAEACWYLASSSSAYINGVTLPITGGAIT